MSRIKPNKQIAPLVLTAALAACSGGGTTPATKAPSQRTPVSFHIAASGQANIQQHRTPKYVAVTTASVELRIHQNGSIVADVTQPLSACITLPAGCTVSVDAPVGASTWDVVTYDAQQNPLSGSANFPFTVVTNTVNVINLVLGGLPQNVAIMFGASDLVSGSVADGFTFQGAATAAGAAVTRTATVAALDADGNTIVGSGAPVMSLSSSDPTHVAIAGMPSAGIGTFSVTTPAYTSAQITLTATAVPASQTMALPATQTATVAFDRHFTTPRIYINDPGAHLVRAYDEAGNAVSTSGTWSGLGEPIGIDYDAHNDTLYVSNYDTGTLDAFDTDGNSIGAFTGMPGTGPEELAVVSTSPVQIAVAHENGHVYRFDESGNALGSFAVGSWPAGLAYDAFDQQLVIADFSDSHVRISDVTGTNIVTTNVVVPSALRVAYDATSHNTYVARSNQITVVSPTGNMVSTTGTFPGLANIYGLAFDSYNNTLYQTSETGGPVGRYDDQGNALAGGGFSGLSTFVSSLVVVP